MKLLTSSLMKWMPLVLLGLAEAKTHDATFKPDYVLEATKQEISINCQTRESVVINGTLPGPTIHLVEGKTTWIRVYNKMVDQNFTMHWHGLTQRAAPFSDGTPMVSQWPIPAGRFFDYEIRPEVGDAGTYFYHSHVGFQLSTAHGALIVDSATAAPYNYTKDITLSFGDYYPKTDHEIETGLLSDPFKWSGEPEAVTINGKSGNQSFAHGEDTTCAPLIIDVEPDTTYRIRAIGRTVISLVKLGIEHHDHLEVIEADGEYTQPVVTDHMQVAPGQRFSYLLKTKSLHDLLHLNQSLFWVRYETRERPVSVKGYALLRYRLANGHTLANRLPRELPAVPPVTLTNSTIDYLENVLSPLSEEVRAAFPSSKEVTRTVVIKIKQQLLTGEWVNNSPNGSLVWVQNGHAWQENVQAATRNAPYLVAYYEDKQQRPNHTLALENNGFDPETRVFPALPGEVIDIVWENDNGASGNFDYHPMHIHGEHAYDLGAGNGTYDPRLWEEHFRNGFIPARRDTTNLYRYIKKSTPGTTLGWRAWRIRVTEENIGAWMMHCHVAQHSAMGMNTVWVFGDEADILKKYPSSPYRRGYLQYGGSAYGNGTTAPVAEHYFR